MLDCFNSRPNETRVAKFGASNAVYSNMAFFLNCALTYQLSKKTYAFEGAKKAAKM